MRAARTFAAYGHRANCPLRVLSVVLSQGREAVLCRRPRRIAVPFRAWFLKHGFGEFINFVRTPQRVFAAKAAKQVINRPAWKEQASPGGGGTEGPMDRGEDQAAEPALRATTRRQFLTRSLLAAAGAVGGGRGVGGRSGQGGRGGADHSGAGRASVRVGAGLADAAGFRPLGRHAGHRAGRAGAHLHRAHRPSKQPRRPRHRGLRQKRTLPDLVGRAVPGRRARAGPAERGQARVLVPLRHGPQDGDEDDAGWAGGLAKGHSR